MLRVINSSTIIFLFFILINCSSNTTDSLTDIQIDFDSFNTVPDIGMPIGSIYSSMGTISGTEKLEATKRLALIIGELIQYEALNTIKLSLVEDGLYEYEEIETEKNALILPSIPYTEKRDYCSVNGNEGYADIIYILNYYPTTKDNVKYLTKDSLYKIEFKDFVPYNTKAGISFKIKSGQVLVSSKCTDLFVNEEKQILIGNVENKVKGLVDITYTDEDGLPEYDEGLIQLSGKVGLNNNFIGTLSETEIVRQPLDLTVSADADYIRDFQTVLLNGKNYIISINSTEIAWSIYSFLIL